MAKNCNNCDYCAENGEDLVCINSESEFLGDFVEENHCCCDWYGVEEEE